MTILLIGGGSGGHITPLLAVARELKIKHPGVKIIGVCEKGSKFVSLYQEDKSVDRVFQVRAGKYRRYAGIPWYKKIFDLKTIILNIRDVFKTIAGYREAKGLLRQLNPDALLIKGGFVSVPVGKAAAKLNIPYITHDSDSSPGLANKLISDKATFNATGMPTDLYGYPPQKAVYTGIPLRSEFKKVTLTERASFRENLGLSGCSHVISVIGGSLGAQQLNKDFAKITSRLMQAYPSLGISIITGKAHEKEITKTLDGELLSDERRRVIVKGFTSDLHVLSGAADLVITRAGATNMSEFALQALPIIIVPGKLAGGHQHKNSEYMVKKGAAIEVEFGDIEGLYKSICNLIDNPKKRSNLARELHALAKPNAAKDLADLVLKLTES